MDSGAGDAAGEDAETSPVGMTTGDCMPGAVRMDGACRCFPQIPTACPVIGCVDVENDDDNCGACGHACAEGAACDVGKCRAAPVVFRSARAGTCEGMDLAADGDSVFWADRAEGTIMRLPVAGVPPSMIAAGEDAPHSIAAHGALVYWLTGATANAFEVAASLRVGSPSAAATTVIAPGGGLGGFVVSPDGETIYFSTGSTVAKVPALASGTPVVVATIDDGGIAQALAVDETETHLAFTTSGTAAVWGIQLVEGAVARCGLQDQAGNDAGVMCTRLNRGFGAILPRGERVYWADGRTIKSNAIWSETQQSWEQVGTDDLNGVTAIAISGTYLFYSDFDPLTLATATIGEIDLTTSIREEKRLARNQKNPRSIASDGTSVYWSTDDCAIMRAPVP